MFGSVIIFGKAKASISVAPVQSGTLTYNGEEQSPAWTGFDSNVMEIGGTASAVNAGTYTATFTPKEGYVWSDGSTDAKSAEWTIGRASIAAAPSQKGTLTYNGTQQTPEWNGYDSEKMSNSGVGRATNAGTFQAVFTPTANYRWSDGSTEGKNVPWTIQRAVIGTIPSQQGTLTYNGEEQTPVWDGYDSEKMSISGTTKGSNAWTYTARFTPKSNYQWSDGDVGVKSVSWSIGKAPSGLTLDKTSLTLDVTNLRGFITATKGWYGKVRATSSDRSVVTLDNSEVGSSTSLNIWMEAVGPGSATITVTADSDQNHEGPFEATCTVRADVPSRTLADNTPAVIQAAAKAGTASNFWSVGDRIPIAVNGSFGGLAYNDTICAFILGFNHNREKESRYKNTIHFQFGKTAEDGKDLAFVQDYKGSGTGFCMHQGGSYGRWDGCYMRKTICPAFLNALPAEWQAVIADCTKYTENAYNSGTKAGAVTGASEKIWLLSEFEVQGVCYYANTEEQNYQLQYDYYKNGNSKVKHMHTYKNSASVTACGWLMRSVRAGANANATDARFCFVQEDGNEGTCSPSDSYGFAPCFMVA